MTIILIVLFVTMVLVSTFIGYRIGADDLEVQKREVDFLKHTRGLALEEAKFWKGRFLDRRVEWNDPYGAVTRKYPVAK